MTGTEVIEETIRILLSGSREEMNKLDANVGNGDEPFIFTYSLGGIREGAQICIDNELARVWSVDDGTKTAIVERGLLGSFADNHLAGSLVYVNPRFPRFAVLKAINDELRALSSPSNGLFRVDSYELTYNAAVTDYALPSDVVEVYDVFTDTFGPSQAWVRVPHWSWNPNADDTDFADSKSIRIPSGYPGRKIRIVYKAAFGQVANPNNDLETEALFPVEMHDILTLGVLMRLGPNREIKRNFTEAQSGDSRRADEVQAGAVQNSFAWVRNQRQARITEERMRLERLYPPRHPAR